MKRRDPQGFGDAVVRILGDLTAEVCAGAVGKSASLVRKWSDDDQDARPNIEQACALDSLHVAEGLSTPETAPILSVWLRRLQVAAAGAPSLVADILTEFLDVPRAVGRLADLIRESRADNIITPRERLDIRQAIATARRELDELEAAVEAESARHQPRAANGGHLRECGPAPAAE